MVIVPTHGQTIHAHLLVYCTFSTLHLVHLWVSDVEHMKGSISSYTRIKFPLSNNSTCENAKIERENLGPSIELLWMDSWYRSI